LNQHLSLSRAARLVGIKRGTLQKRIQNGEILTFEGAVSLDDLIKAYPQTELEDNTMIERAQRIKDAAVNKIIHETVLPSSELLLTRINKLTSALGEAKSLANKHIDLVDELKSRLEATDKNAIDEFKSWFYDKLESLQHENNAPAQLIANDSLLSLMTAHVRILPSGHDFFVEGTSNLLEAGLRSGLALDYACSNGNCGKCKAKVISGEVNKIQHHDYVLSDADKTSNHILMCCNAAVSDIVLQAPEASGADEIPQQNITAKIKTIDTSHPDVALLHLKTPRSNRLRFLAGQFVTLNVNDDITDADLSISSCPCDDMNLHFQIPKIDGNDFSAYVFKNLTNGDTIDITGPGGEFTLNENSYRSLVFITWHTGFAPIRSLVEHAMALDIAENVHLYWIAQNKENRYLDNLCRSWDDALDNFYYHPVDADLDNFDAGDTQTIIRKIFDDLDNPREHDFYIAGRQTMLDACEVISIEREVPQEQLISDLILHD